MTKRGVVWWAVGRQGVVGTSTTGGQDVGSPNLAALEKDYEEVGLDSAEAGDDGEGDEY